MPETHSNVLLLMSDQHSYRHIGRRDRENGGEPVSTPAFDELAESSVAFDNAYCPTPLCTPSRLSMLTGREPQNAGAWGNWSVLNPSHETLPGTFSDAGYRTCLQGKMHLGGNQQFVGFDHRPYGDLTGQTGHQFEPPNKPLRHGYEPDFKSLITDVGETSLPESLLQEQNVKQESIAYLREHQYTNPDQPWLLCASFSRPHWPRKAPKRHFERYWPDDVPEPPVGEESDAANHPVNVCHAKKSGSVDVTVEETMRARAAYLACVDYLDEIIGDFISTLERDGLLEDTIVVYLSDHGDLCGEHGLWDKETYHEASTRVPCYIQLPEHRDGSLDPSRIQTPISLIDLFPTLCGLTNIPVPEGVDGVDLSDAILMDDEPDRGPVFTDCFIADQTDGTEYRMVRDGKYKYIQFRDAPELLFDLEEDPNEIHNLAPEAAAEDRQALERLRAVVAQTMDFEAAAEKRKEDQKLKEEYKLEIPNGGPNQYYFPDGRVVDADTPIYEPVELSDSPHEQFDEHVGPTE